MADLRGYVTAAGQQFEALAKQMGYPVIIGMIEIGDGALPDSESPIARTRLVNPIASFPAIVEQDVKNPGQWVASIHIPPDHAINGAGYFIREIGCKLINQGAGVLYAYRRVSNDWKPIDTSGEAKSFIYKLRFIPSNGELLKPTIDPTVVLVDRDELDRVMKEHKESRDHPAGTKTEEGLLRIANETEALAGLLESVAIAPKGMRTAMEALLDIVVPIGMPTPWVAATPPNNRFLIAQGQAFDKAAYPKLAALWPTGVIPFDLRADFIRGWDNGRGVDAGRTLLSAQGDAIREIAGTIVADAILNSVQTSGLLGSGVFKGTGNALLGKALQGMDYAAGVNHRSMDFRASNVVPTASENRPRNIAFNYIIRAA